ncbi:MAG: 16S rRNA (uracil(1498)-N(3))-methyltransferase [Flavobacteriales bacterium]
MKHLFYSNQISTDNLLLDEEESVHAQRVLRLKQGDRIWVTNGQGHLYECSITETGKKSITAAIHSSTTVEKPDLRIHLAIAPTKNMDRLEWLVEKLVETGITSITPVLCSHAERKVVKTDRLKKIALTAMKQSQQYWLPEIKELTNLGDFVSSLKVNHAKKLIAHCRNPSIPYIKEYISKDCMEYWILIGPEGDFAEPEIELALKNNWQEISLGETRLRTETAGLVACLAIHSFIR